MFSVMGVVVFVALGIFLTFLARRQYRGSDSRFVGYLFASASYVVAVIWFVSATAGSYTNQLSDLTVVKQNNMQINLDKEKRDRLICVLKEELLKYPEIEKGIINNIKPDIMLLSQFPNLKSNEVIVNMVDKIVYLENIVYEKRSSLLDLQRQIYYREISPWVICSITKYDSFLKEANPFGK